MATIWIEEVNTEPGEVEVIAQAESDRLETVDIEIQVESTEVLFGPEEWNTVTLSSTPTEYSVVFEHDWVTNQELTAAAYVDSGYDSPFDRMDFTMEGVEVSDPELPQPTGGEMVIEPGENGFFIDEITVEVGGGNVTAMVDVWVDVDGDTEVGPYPMPIDPDGSWTDYDGWYVGTEDGTYDVCLNAEAVEQW